MPQSRLSPRVIEQTVKQKLPEGFQRAEFLLEHGFIDKIVERKDMKKTLYKILKFHKKTVQMFSELIQSDMQQKMIEAILNKAPESMAGMKRGYRGLRAKGKKCGIIQRYRKRGN